jgi:rod shape-determining protein MreB
MVMKKQFQKKKALSSKKRGKVVKRSGPKKKALSSKKREKAVKKSGPKKKALSSKKRGKVVKKSALVSKVSGRNGKAKVMKFPVLQVPGRNNQLILGIDLGTSWTAVMSSRGGRYNDRTIVGYPKDIIGQQVVDSNFVVGEDALRQRESLSLYFPLERGVVKDVTKEDITAAEALLTYAVSLAHPRPEDKVCSIIGVPAQASIISRELLLSIAKDVFHVAAVVSEPFLVAYALNKITNSIVIDIGAGTIDVCIMKGALPGAKDQITFFKAGNYLDRSLETAITTKHPNVQITNNLTRKIKEKYSFVGKSNGRAMAILRADGQPTQFDLTKEIKTVCESIVPEIIEKVEMLIPQFDPEEQEEALKNIYLAGGGSRIKGLDKMIANKLKKYGKVIVKSVDDPDFAGCVGALKMAIDVPPSKWGQIGCMQGIS